MNAFLAIIVVLVGFFSSRVYAQTATPQKFEVGTVRLLNTSTVLSATSKGKLIWKIKSPGNICSALDHKQVGFVLNLCNSILVLNRQNGKAVWRRPDLAPRSITIFAKDRLLVETTADGASASTLTTVINASTGINVVEGYGFIIYNNLSYVLLLNDGLAESASGDRLWFSKISVVDNKVEVKFFQLSPRSGCGTEDDLTSPSVERVDNQFIYARVDDLCGFFDVKLEWSKGRYP